jgi:PhzF family phenazine biosynthesis protein
LADKGDPVKIDVNVVNAFIDGDAGGNPAGIVLDADHLTTKQKQNIAVAVGLSETAFVSSSVSADFKLEFFTPTRQIAHCGHATIATFNLLHQLGRIPSGSTSKETIDGNRQIFINNRMAFMEQVAPRYRAVDGDMDRIMASLGLSPEALPSEAGPLIVDTGNPFLIVPLENLRTVGGVNPDLETIQTISEDLDLIGYYIFSSAPQMPGRDASARMFAPRFGINEEAATGMAAGPLACYLYEKMGIQQEIFRIGQGHFMTLPSPSVIEVRLRVEDSRISGLLAGGKAKTMSSITITL